MDSADLNIDFHTAIAAAADICFKPWLHAVLDHDKKSSNPINANKSLDLLLTIECRNKEGVRQPSKDIELEIYRSGNDLNLILSWLHIDDAPILWQGKHSIWMDSVTGKRCAPPTDGHCLESFARRLRSLFVSQSKY